MIETTADQVFRLYYDNFGRLDCVNHVESGALVWTTIQGSDLICPFGADWQAGLDSGFYSLGDRPDLAVAEPEPEPDWGQFRLAMISNAAYMAFAVQVSAHPVGNALIPHFLVAIGAAEPNLTAVIGLWNQLLGLGVLPDVGAIAQWHGIADATHMPFDFVGAGELALR